MSIWGKIVGGVAGFWLGGPLGAIAGVAAGHLVDRTGAASDAPRISHDDGMDGPGAGADPRTAAADSWTKKTAFTVALIVLGAKMAKADGQVTRDEVDAFKQVFRIPPKDMGTVGRIFDQAKQDPLGYEPYAQQLVDIFGPRAPILEEFLDGLFHIAKADGVVHPNEVAFLRRVAGIFGFEDREFDRVNARHVPDGNPYEILGVPHTADDAAIKSAYRALVRENHPDKLVAEGLPEEMITMATERMAAINAAYDAIQKQREIS
ncbi:MAG: TerB family tellurite resistance protein [Magnetospiraceae bacterium]